MKIIKYISKKELEKQVLKRKCDDCNMEQCDNCEDYLNRCPNCKESIDNDTDWEFKYCPYCGQKLKY